MLQAAAVLLFLLLCPPTPLPTPPHLSHPDIVTIVSILVFLLVLQPQLDVFAGQLHHHGARQHREHVEGAQASLVDEGEKDVCVGVGGWAAERRMWKSAVATFVPACSSRVWQATRVLYTRAST